MATELLVEKLKDGELLIRQLLRDEIDVEVAFWERSDEGDLWRLYIASRYPRINKMNEAFRVLYASLAKISDCSVLPSEITLLTDTDPTTQDAVRLRDRYQSKEPIHLQGKRLNNRTSADLWIYPRRFPMHVRQTANGDWEVLLSESPMWLKCDTEDDARTIAAVPVLEYEALAHIRSGEQFAGELERTADVLAKYRLLTGYRFFTHYAEDVRKRSA